MESRVLDIPKEEIGQIIGKRARHVRLINKLIAPGSVTVEDDVVTLRGRFNPQWISKATRVIRSVRRGGFIKFFDSRQRKKFMREIDQEWLREIRKVEHRTLCTVSQLNFRERGEVYEAWVVLEDVKESNLDEAIEDIGALIHKRFQMQKV